MKLRSERILLRVGSVLLMLAAAVCAIYFTWRAQMTSIVQSLSPMQYFFSDDELEHRLSAFEAADNVYAAVAGADKKYDVGSDFLDFLFADDKINASGTLSDSIRSYIVSNGYDDDMWGKLTGLSFSVLYDIYTGAANDGSVHVLGDIYGQKTTTLAFGGDVNLSYDWYNMARYREIGTGGCFDTALLDVTNDADIMFVNNEFSISTRGAPLDGKKYTFRADPADLDIYDALGVDVVSVANNHVYDYGPDAFSDTLMHLDEHGTLHVGAGMNADEASRTLYIISGGLKIAFCSASCAEVNRFTPVAEAEKAGVFGMYDPEDFLAAVADAKSHADIVIAYVHFGVEGSTDIDDGQAALAHRIVDAGADIVIGAHPHVLQPIEYYNGAPIVYSLGNFWFNTTETDTALLTVSVSVGMSPILRYYPCRAVGGALSLADNENAARIISDINAGSIHAAVGDDRRVREVLK